MPSKLSADASDSPAAQKPVMHSGEPLKHRLLRAQMPVPQAGGWLPSRLQQLRAVCQPLITNLAFLKSAQTESKGVANKIKGSQTKSRGRKQNQKRSQTKSRGRKQNQGVANKIKGSQTVMLVPTWAVYSQMSTSSFSPQADSSF